MIRLILQKQSDLDLHCLSRPSRDFPTPLSLGPRAHDYGKINTYCDIYLPNGKNDHDFTIKLKMYSQGAHS